MKLRGLRSVPLLLCLLAAIVIQTEKPLNNKDAASAEPIKNASAEVPEANQHQVVAAYGKVPLSLEANQDQTDAQVKFFSRGCGYTLFLTSTEAVSALQKYAAPMMARHKEALCPRA